MRHATEVYTIPHSLPIFLCPMFIQRSIVTLHPSVVMGALTYSLLFFFLHML